VLNEISISIFKESGITLVCFCRGRKDPWQKQILVVIAYSKKAIDVENLVLKTNYVDV